MAKLWMCERLRTLIRGGDPAPDSATERTERDGDCWGEEELEESMPEVLVAA